MIKLVFRVDAWFPARITQAQLAEHSQLLPTTNPTSLDNSSDQRKQSSKQAI